MYHPKPLKFIDIVTKANLNDLMLKNFKKSFKESELVKIERYPGPGRFGGEWYSSLKPDGVSCIKKYEGFFWMFDFNEFLRTQFKLLMPKNKQNHFLLERN